MCLCSGISLNNKYWQLIIYTVVVCAGLFFLWILVHEKFPRQTILYSPWDEAVRKSLIHHTLEQNSFGGTFNEEVIQRLQGWGGDDFMKKVADLVASSGYSNGTNLSARDKPQAVASF